MAFFAHFAVVARHAVFASAEIITTTTKKEHAAYRATYILSQRNAEPAHLNMILDLVSASMIFGLFSVRFGFHKYPFLPNITMEI